MVDPKLVSVRPHAAAGLEQGLEDLAALPLQWDGPPIGVIVGMIPAGVLQPGTFSYWRRIAFDVALALRYCAAIHDARHIGTEHERLRMREELHDSVSQRLFAACLLAARAEADARAQEGSRTSRPDAGVDVRGGGAPTLVPQMEELRRLLAEASSAVRALIAEPHQSADDTPLSRRLTTLTEEFANRSGLKINVDVDGGWDELNRECVDDVVRIVRECLRNVVKHARATCVWVSLPPAVDEMLLVQVADDGAGFDPQDVGQTSFGLSLITERAAERGGRCAVHVKGGGTTMRVHLMPEYESDWQLARRALERQAGASGSY